ncbi:type II toxin-antitoxin system HipA family toxin [Flavobacterium piscinae]|uniref:Type II toxin-antitoxin system HipA family toxin n=1 Tax=Flavobacterium piscinae TaxID=2506424 RepID=A0A4Q1KP15_9FLAO|nr:HipA domain-containing protein [Flavobacterium piscinae]RXR30594.1 type II toxin-antitoxin system HipA family toxin [Flavobacterium piscinae]
MKNYKKKYLARLENPTLEVQEPRTFYGKRCLYCYEPLFDPSSDFHDACNKRFFGQLKTPQLNYNLDNLQELASKVIQSQMAVTGVQAKVSLSLFRKEEKNLTKKLTIVGLYGDYILKPPSEQYEQLPELESVTMHMADVCGIKVVPHSLVKLQDRTLCYITKRVDRTRKTKLHMEDMCQLSERLTEDKYKGSHEQVAKLVLNYSSTPLLDVSNFYEQVLFSFFTGNSDMHLKNFSLLEREGQGLSLCPAYDLVPTALVNPADTEELALTLNAKKRKLKYNDFLVAYENCGLSKKVLDNTLELFVYAKPEMEAVLAKSFVRDEYKIKYLSLMENRYKQLELL